MIGRKRALIVIDKRIHPSGLSGDGRFVVPLIVEVFVFVFKDGNDSVSFLDCINGIVASVFREHIGLDRDGAARCKSVLLDNSPGIGHQGVRTEIIFHQPGR